MSGAGLKVGYSTLFIIGINRGVPVGVNVCEVFNFFPQYLLHPIYSFGLLLLIEICIFHSQSRGLSSLILHYC